jgi:hypothetical protein
MFQGRKPETVYCNDLKRKDVLDSNTLETEIYPKMNCQIVTVHCYPCASIQRFTVHQKEKASL